MNAVYGELHEALRQVLAYRLGWDNLRDIQEQAYTAVSTGHDVLVLAPTAGGKTEAALIPVIDAILKEGLPGIAGIYIAPLKALINDQEERFSAFCRPTGLELLKWHGDVPKGDRTWSEGEPPHFLMITPESLEVLLMEQSSAAGLKNLRYVIVDELHAFVESERGAHLMVLLDRLDRNAGRAIQRTGLSATVGNPDAILAWFGGGRRPATRVQVPIPPKKKQFTFIVEKDPRRRMDALARVVTGKKALVFVNSRGDAEQVARELEGRVGHLSVHHSSLSPQIRKAAEEAFSGPGSACIICTSTLELGIDIGDLDVVVQVGPPGSVSSFLQRMGRSGRRGKPPYVACVHKDSCELACMVAVIECASRKEVETLTPMKKPYNLLAQQILLLLRRHPRSSRAAIRKFVRGLTPFRGIRQKNIDLLLDHLVAEEFCVRDGDILMMGPAAEKLYGRSNWKDLFSVISSGDEFRAVTPDGEVVGKLDARFVAGREGGSFSLGGKSWTLIKSDETHDLVVVVPGEGKKAQVFWTGGQGGFSTMVCRAVADIIIRGHSVLPVPGPESEYLAGFIGKFSYLTTRDLYVIEKSASRGTDVVILTFRGRKFNSILAALLKAKLGGKVRIPFHDFSIRIQGGPRKGAFEKVMDALATIRQMGIHEIGNMLKIPGAEQWKFARALPDALVREMAESDYYPIEEFVQELEEAEVRVIREGEP